MINNKSTYKKIYHEVSWRDTEFYFFNPREFFKLIHGENMKKQNNEGQISNFNIPFVNMDSYLIRIYRRDKKNPEAVIGVIEEIGTNKKRSFANLKELSTFISKGIRRKHHEQTK